MKFKKFTILNPKGQLASGEDQEVLFNVDHIVSIKPIRISTANNLVNGFWIRTTNGKKYKATKIPEDLLKEIGEQYAKPISILNEGDEPSFQ